MQYTTYEHNEEFYRKIFQMSVREKKNAYDISKELNIPFGETSVARRKAQIIAYYRKYGKLPEKLKL